MGTRMIWKSCYQSLVLVLSNLSMSFFMSSLLTSEKYFFFTIALYCKYTWMIFVFKDSFKRWICYVFCNRIKFTEFHYTFEKKLFRVSAVSDSVLNPLSANPTKWSNTLKQFVNNFPTNCMSVFDHFVKLVLKGLRFIFFYFN